MPTRLLLAILTAALVGVGCGGDDGDGGDDGNRPRPSTASLTKAQALDRLEEACRDGERDLARPLEVERRLPKSSIPTTTKDERFIRAAKVLRGQRAVIDRILRVAKERRVADAVGGATDAFALALQRLSSELEGYEAAMRYEYNVPVTEKLRPLWRRVRTTAASARLAGCRRL